MIVAACSIVTHSKPSVGIMARPTASNGNLSHAVGHAKQRPRFQHTSEQDKPYILWKGPRSMDETDDADETDHATSHDFILRILRSHCGAGNIRKPHSEQWSQHVAAALPEFLVSNLQNQKYRTLWLFSMANSHGKSPFLIGKPSINGSFSMAM